MATQTTINLGIYINGQLIDLDSLPRLTDPTQTFGVLRLDTGAEIVDEDTPFVRLATGTYRYSFDNPAEADTNPDFSYEIGYTLVYNSITRRYTRIGIAGIINLSYLIPVPSHFSSEAEVMRFLGEFAVQLFAEDWEYTDKSQVWSEILGYVDDTIRINCEQHYDVDSITSNRYLRHRATVLAAQLLSQRRGNPALYVRQAQEIRDELADIRTGKTKIPGATPIGNFGPVVRNYIMQPFRGQPMRVESLKSMGDAYANEAIAFVPYFYALGW